MAPKAKRLAVSLPGLALPRWSFGEAGRRLWKFFLAQNFLYL